MTKHRGAERRIASFFSDKGCIASDPDEDMHGWDIFVEFPRPSYNGPAEDRPPVPRAYLQVKSTKVLSSNSASIKLSNVQIATTSHDPWFIIRAYPNKTYRVLHIWGEVLYEWIRAVRVASLASKALNKEKISITFDGPRLNEDQLVDHVSATISNVGEPYEVKKKELIENLRYRDGAGTGTFTLTASGHTNLR